MFIKIKNVHGIEIVANTDSIQSVLFLHAEKRYVIRFGAGAQGVLVPIDQANHVVEMAGFNVRWFSVYGSEFWTSPAKIEYLQRFEGALGASCGVYLVGESHIDFVTEEQYEKLVSKLMPQKATVTAHIIRITTDTTLIGYRVLAAHTRENQQFGLPQPALKLLKSAGYDTLAGKWEQHPIVVEIARAGASWSIVSVQPKADDAVTDADEDITSYDVPPIADE